MSKGFVLTQELQHMLLTRLAEGELLSDILKTPGMPSRVSIIRLLKVDEEFNQHYLLAKEMQADAIFDRHFKRAVLERDPNKMTDASERLAFEAAKWALGKLMPKKYGDKIQNETTVNGSLNVGSLSNTELDETLRNEIARVVAGSSKGKTEPDD